MTKLHNPTDKDLNVQIEGVVYNLVAGGTLDLTPEVAKYWKEQIHNFLEEATEDVKPKATAKVESSEKKEKTIATKVKEAVSKDKN